MKKRVLIIVDLQKDFCPGGALAVPEGDQTADTINKLLDCYDLVVLTQDWHPADHGSFAANHPGKGVYESVELGGLLQTLWPVHCVQESDGASFIGSLNVPKGARVFRKGTDPEIDSYSGFFDNGHKKSTGLGEYLTAEGVTDADVCGLATDYCVKATAIDAVGLGFKVRLVADACRGVNLQPDDVAKAVAEMRGVGVEMTDSALVLSEHHAKTLPAAGEKVLNAEFPNGMLAHDSVSR